MESDSFGSVGKSINIKEKSRPGESRVRVFLSEDSRKEGRIREGIKSQRIGAGGVAKIVQNRE